MEFLGYVGVYNLFLRDNGGHLAATTNSGIRSLGGEDIGFKERNGVT
jgi:hypothetical protein